jgi:hypothetical protein
MRCPFFRVGVGNLKATWLFRHSRLCLAWLLQRDFPLISIHREWARELVKIHLSPLKSSARLFRLEVRVATTFPM